MGCGGSGGGRVHRLGVPCGDCPMGQAGALGVDFPNALKLVFDELGALVSQQCFRQQDQ